MSTRARLSHAAREENRRGNNNDIGAFLDGKHSTRKDLFTRQDSGLTRDSANSGLGGATRPRKAGGHGLGIPDFEVDPAIPTRDRNYGARKRMPMSVADKNDKIIEFERENNTLKEKRNLLDAEILMMRTKLRRIEELIRKRSRMEDSVDGSMEYSARDMQRDLEGECDELRNQNKEIKEKVRKLNVVQRGLT